jgi:hypothetical protein
MDPEWGGGAANRVASAPSAAATPAPIDEPSSGAPSDASYEKRPESALPAYRQDPRVVAALKRQYARPPPTPYQRAGSAGAIQYERAKEESREKEKTSWWEKAKKIDKSTIAALGGAALLSYGCVVARRFTSLAARHVSFIRFDTCTYIFFHPIECSPETRVARRRR